MPFAPPSNIQKIPRAVKGEPVDRTELGWAGFGGETGPSFQFSCGFRVFSAQPGHTKNGVFPAPISNLRCPGPQWPKCSKSGYCSSGNAGARAPSILDSRAHRPRLGFVGCWLGRKKELGDWGWSQKVRKPQMFAREVIKGTR